MSIILANCNHCVFLFSVHCNHFHWERGKAQKRLKSLAHFKIADKARPNENKTSEGGKDLLGSQLHSTVHY